MVFWILLIIAVIGIVGGIIAYESVNDFAEAVFGVLCLFGFIGLAVSVYFFVSNEIEYLDREKINEQKYQSLVYEIGNDESDGKSLVDDVIKWNSEIAVGKRRQRDFWIGIYIPNIYDEFDYIDIRGLKK